MRVLFTTHATSGHFHPLVPLAKATVDAGHEVAFATNEFFCPSVEASGFECLAAGYTLNTHWSEATFEEQFPEYAEVPQGLEKMRWMASNIFAGLMLERMIPDLIAHVETWEPDLLIREPSEFAAAIVGEMLDIPYATAGWPLFFPHELWFELVGDELNAVRAEYVLPVDAQLEMLHPFLYLAFAPTEFAGDSEHFPATAHLFRPVSFDRSGSEGLPGWIDSLPDQPTIYTTLGTVFNDEPGVFEMIIDAFRDEPVNLIMTVGRNQDPGRFGPLPDHIHVERYIPQSLLLPYCDLVVAHSGYNTVVNVLGAGLPMLSVPIGGDQVMQAGPGVNMGAAIMIPPEDRSTDAIREGARKLLATPSYRENAERFRDRLQLMPGPDQAVSLLEQLVRDRKPILR